MRSTLLLAGLLCLALAVDAKEVKSTATAVASLAKKTGTQKAAAKTANTAATLLSTKVAQSKSTKKDSNVQVKAQANAKPTPSATAASKVAPKAEAAHPAVKREAVHSTAVEQMRFKATRASTPFGMPGSMGMITPFGPSPAYGAPLGAVNGGVTYLGSNPNPYHLVGNPLYNNGGLGGPMNMGAPSMMGSAYTGYNSLPGAGGSFNGMSMPGIASASGPGMAAPGMLGAGQQGFSSYPFMLNVSVMGQQVPMGAGGLMGVGGPNMGFGMAIPGPHGITPPGAMFAGGAGYGSPYMSPASYFPMMASRPSPAMQSMFAGNMMHGGMGPTFQGGHPMYGGGQMAGGVGSGAPTGFLDMGTALFGDKATSLAPATEQVVTSNPATATNELSTMTGQQFMAMPSTLDASSAQNTQSQGTFDASLLMKDPTRPRMV